MSDTKMEITVVIQVRESGPYGGGQMVTQSEVKRDVVNTDRLEQELEDAILTAQSHTDSALTHRRRELRKAKVDTEYESLS